MSKLTVPILVDWENIESYMALNDIVHVVRCKDCIHNIEDEDFVHCELDNGYGWVSPDFYCADGERKDGAE